MGTDLPEQAVEARTTDVCGVDMSPVNLYRWTPAFAAGAQLPGYASLSARYLAHLLDSAHVVQPRGGCALPQRQHFKP